MSVSMLGENIGQVPNWPVSNPPAFSQLGRNVLNHQPCNISDWRKDPRVLYVRPLIRKHMWVIIDCISDCALECEWLHENNLYVKLIIRSAFHVNIYVYAVFPCWEKQTTIRSVSMLILWLPWITNCLWRLLQRFVISVTFESSKFFYLSVYYVFKRGNWITIFFLP